MIKLVRVQTKKSRYSASSDSIFQIGTHPNGSITIFKNVDNKSTPIIRGSTFAVGDSAEYDSYNLSYVGTITKITNKTVTILAYPGSTIATVHRLDLHSFCWRNFAFNAAETARKNSIESMYI